MKILNIIGTRPNFIKIISLLKAARQDPSLKMRLVHTGQHYDDNMSRVFFKHLALPAPHIYLGIGSGSLSSQTARLMMALEKAVLKEKPDLIIVVGDVNSTLAGSLVAAQLSIPLVHIEAGLRSFDYTMPEEINRVITDRLADLLFAPSDYARENLRREGIPANRIFVVGNIMIDTLYAHFNQIKKAESFRRLGLKAQSYILVTLHRPVNVDNRKTLLNIIKALISLNKIFPVILPLHPRTKKQIIKFGLNKYFKAINSSKDFIVQTKSNKIRITEPVGYIDSLNLIMNARLVLTDSGGVQEETTALGIPCLTLRDTTEWLDTVSRGTNILVSARQDKIIKAAKTILSRHVYGTRPKKIRMPKYWDGLTAQRIIKIITKQFSK